MLFRSQTHTQTDRHTDRQTHTQTDTHRHTHRQTDTQTDRHQTERQRERQTGAHREAVRQAGTSKASKVKLKDQTVQVIRTSLASVMLFRCFTLDSMVVIVAVPGFNFKFLGVTEVPLTTFKTEMKKLCVSVCAR